MVKPKLILAKIKRLFSIATMQSVVCYDSKE